MVVFFKQLKIAIISRYNTQAEFARDIGVPACYVSMVLHGERRLKPNDAKLWKEKLRIPYETLVPVLHIEKDGFST